jgi:hypothetical protein
LPYNHKISDVPILFSTTQIVQGDLDSAGIVCDKLLTGARIKQHLHSALMVYFGDTILAA